MLNATDLFFLIEEEIVQELSDDGQEMILILIDFCFHLSQVLLRQSDVLV